MGASASRDEGGSRALLRRAPFINEQYERFVEERRGLLAERRALRERLVVADDDSAQQEIEWQLAVLSRRCARHRRQAWRDRGAILIEELREAQRSDRPFEVHRLRRLIAANKRGPKKRIVGVLANFHPSTQEVIDFYGQPGSQGGVAAVPADFQTLLLCRKGQLTGMRRSERASISLARWDFTAVCRALKRAAKRKWTPEWALPLELWHACLIPDHRWGRALRRAGLGSGARPPRNTAIRQALLQFLAQCRDTGLAPLVWARLRGIFISKGSGKALFKSVRGGFHSVPIRQSVCQGVY